MLCIPQGIIFHIPQEQQIPGAILEQNWYLAVLILMISISEYWRRKPQTSILVGFALCVLSACAQMFTRLARIMYVWGSEPCIYINTQNLILQAFMNANSLAKLNRAICTGRDCIHKVLQDEAVTEMFPSVWMPSFYTFRCSTFSVPWLSM